MMVAEACIIIPHAHPINRHRHRARIHHADSAGGDDRDGDQAVGEPGGDAVAGKRRVRDELLERVRYAGIRRLSELGRGGAAG